MSTFRRVCCGGLGFGRRGFAAWKGLGAFVEGQQQQQAWALLLQCEQQVSSKCKAAAEAAAEAAAAAAAGKDPNKGIDWAFWERSIAHKDIVNCLRSHYEQQESAYGRLLGSSAAAAAQQQQQQQQAAAKELLGEGLLQQALESCAAAVAASQQISSKGAAALWLSCRNPPLSALSTNDWLDTDCYWQAFLEKHFFYSQYQPGTEDPESAGSKRSSKERVAQKGGEVQRAYRHPNAVLVYRLSSFLG
ncbi:hypothetical protein ETH_00017665, partial [Eimeria tenella]